MSSPVYIGLDTPDARPHALFRPSPKIKPHQNASNMNKLNAKNFSPLMDPILLESHAIQKMSKPSLVSKVWNKLSHLNMYNLTVNVIIPVCVFLFVAFQLKSKWEKKRERDDELLLL
jgi:hypothetical protein